ncbi:MAG: S-layer homology domain-containing protein [Acidimicrobiia bacterium]
MKGKTRRSVVVLAVVAMIAALLAIPVAPAGAASAACDNAPSAGFTDLTGFTAETVNAVDCIAFYDITKGTSATTYGPSADVSRWQMALFLTRKLAAAGVTLPSGADQGFTDISGYDAATQLAINQLAQLNVTKGTSATTFDPTGVVSRWQMALFMTREVVAAGVTLPTAVDQGFTDITGLSAEYQTAINQLAQLGISKGTSATTYGPAGNVNRWQMALFLARDLDVLGVVPAGTGFIVTDKDIVAPGLSVSYADTTQGKVVKATLKTAALGDLYYVDGAAATQGAFLTAASVGDLLAVNGQTYLLTNKTAASYTSGVIDNVVALTGFDIIEPISGVVLSSKTTGGTYQLYTTDGGAVSIAGFDLDANAGDTVVITGKGTVSSIQTIALTNQTIAGTVKGTAVATFGLKPFADTFTATATDTLTVDGDAVVLADFQAPVLSDGDSVTYSMKGGKQTIALTNGAMAAIAGKVLNNDGIPATVDIDESGTAALAETYVNAGTVYIVNGTIDNVAGFEAALTAGDSISIVRADTEVNTVDRVTLTDGAFTGTPVVRGVGTITVQFEASGPATEAIDYTSMTPDLDISGTTATKWTINGVAAASQAAFEAAVDSAILNGGTISVTKVGTALVWNIAS